MIRLIPLVAAVLAAAASAPLHAQSCPDADALRAGLEGPLADVRYLADDALQGREAGTPGGRCAAEYLADRLAALGLRPAGDDGGFYQPFPVRTGARRTRPGSVLISEAPPLGSKEWGPYGFAASAVLEAPLVHAGAGVPDHGAPPPGGERAAALPEVQGRIAVIEAETPGAGGLYADPHFKASVAAGRGAVGAVILLPPGASLPSLEGETRPDVGIPVVAVASGEARRVREAALRGDRAFLDVGVEPATARARNVAALLPGTDPALRDEVVVVGAHYDHLGLGGPGSLGPGGPAVHNGADDNASGTAAVLAVAEHLAGSARPPARSVLFLFFDGEERGLLGAHRYVDGPLLPLESTVAMLNLDMVGRLRENTLTVYGVATGEEWTDALQNANAALDAPLRLSMLPDGYGASDHAAFHAEGLPVLHFFTNTHAEYHRPADDWQTLNGEGLVRVAALVGELTATLAGTTGQAPLSVTAAAPAPPPAHGGAAADDAPSRGYGPYLGTIPDMGPVETGVRLAGVREGSPAEEGGLRAGDVIVEFGGREVTDLYQYTYALRDHEPGDEVAVVVLRDGERVTLTVLLGERR